MLRWIARYTGWLHTRWPAGTVEPLPRSDRDGATNVPGVSISGDLTGIPLLKFALDSGAKAARAEGIERNGSKLGVRLEGGGLLAARRVLVAIGRSGDFRMLGVPGESLDKVYNRLHDPKDFSGQKALVVGGGDSAVETAIALAQAGAQVTLVHRRGEITRPQHEHLNYLSRYQRGPRALQLPWR